MPERHGTCPSKAAEDRSFAATPVDTPAGLAESRGVGTLSKRVTIAVMLITVLAMPAWAGVEEGYDAYERGDYVAAFREWLPLAEAGSAEAQFNIGVLFQKGRGVPADSAEALRWYRRAAWQGHADAQNNLGGMLSRGEGIPEDYVQAHMWFSLAAVRGKQSAQRNLDTLAPKMRARDIAQAHRLAENWRAATGQ